MFSYCCYEASLKGLNWYGIYFARSYWLHYCIILLDQSMRNSLIFFLLLALPAICFCKEEQPDSCKQFRTGEFTVEGKTCIKIKRTRKFQYEKNTQEKIKSTFRIEWLNECSYTLTLIRTTDKNPITRDQIGACMPHTIIRTSNKGYTYTTQYSFMSRDQCGAMRRHVKKEETILKVEKD